MNKNKIISECIPIDTKLQVFLASIFFGLFFGVILFGITVIIPCQILHPGKLIYDDGVLSLSSIIILYLINALVTILALRVAINKSNDVYYWKLTKTELIGGKKSDIIIPLHMIEKVILFWPPKTNFGYKFLTKVTKFHPSKSIRTLSNAENIIRSNSLLLKMDNQKFLGLYLHPHPGGSKLMDELVKLIINKVDKNYKYSDEEQKNLNKVRMNKLQTV